MSDTIDFGVYNSLEWDKLSTEYLHGLSDMGNVQAKELLEKKYDLPIECQRVGFGKYSGTKWVELDAEYLHWILENLDANNIKAILASKSLKYIEEYRINDEFGDVIYVD